MLSVIQICRFKDGYEVFTIKSQVSQPFCAVQSARPARGGRGRRTRAHRLRARTTRSRRVRNKRAFSLHCFLSLYTTYLLTT